VQHIHWPGHTKNLVPSNFTNIHTLHNEIFSLPNVFHSYATFLEYLIHRVSSLQMTSSKTLASKTTFYKVNVDNNSSHNTSSIHNSHILLRKNLFNPISCTFTITWALFFRMKSILFFLHSNYPHFINIWNMAFIRRHEKLLQRIAIKNSLRQWPFPNHRDYWHNTRTIKNTQPNMIHTKLIIKNCLHRVAGHNSTFYNENTIII